MFIMDKQHAMPETVFDQGIDLIGTPFCYGARGPHAFDCYGLVMEMARRNGHCLPDFGVASQQAMISAMMGASLPQWQPVDPGPGAVVLIRVGRWASHCAYQIDDHRMIHAWERAHGVSLIRIDEWQQRIVGFYAHAGMSALATPASPSHFGT